MVRFPIAVYRELRQQIRWYRKWSILGSNLRRFKRISDRKPWHTILRELFRCIRYYRCIPDHYFQYDLYLTEVPGERILDYVPDYVMAMKWFPVVNNHFKQHQLLLNNKIFFKQFLRQAGLPVAPAILYVLNRTFYTPDMAMIGIDDALALIETCTARRLFCKSDILDGAYGITCFDRSASGHPYRAGDTVLDASYLRHLDGSGGYLIEEGVEQHPVLSRVNPGSLNTFRVVTQFCPREGAVILYAILRMGTGASCIDNVSRSGVFVVIDPVTGVVQLPAYDKLRDPYDSHPTTGVPFGELELPFFQEIAELCRRAAEKFPTLPSIGWDIGYASDGPVIIEGNDRWGAALYQLAIGGIGPLLLREWFPDGNVPQ